VTAGVGEKKGWFKRKVKSSKNAKKPGKWANLGTKKANWAWKTEKPKGGTRHQQGIKTPGKGGMRGTSLCQRKKCVGVIGQ